MNNDEIYNDNLNEDDGESIGDEALNTNLNGKETTDFHKSFFEQQKRLTEEIAVLIKEINIRFEKERNLYEKVTRADEIFEKSKKNMKK